MRKGMVVAFLLMCASGMVTASQVIAKLQLPCESRYQMISPSGAQIVVACKDHSLHMIDLPQGTEQSIVPAERGQTAVAYSPDGRWLAIGFEDGTVDVISSRDNSPAKYWKADSHRIDGLYFFPNGKNLFVGPADSSATVWDTTPQTPTLLATLHVALGGISACAVSPDGKLLAAAGDDTVIRWYDTATWQKTREYRDFLLETFALAFTPDGKQLLAGGADARVTVFDVATGKSVRQLPPEMGSSVGSLDTLGDKPQVVTGYFDDAGDKPPHALLWDLATDKSTAIKSDARSTCGDVVKGNLWVCTADGKTLTISQHE
jgi:WD40 repeat protein